MSFLGKIKDTISPHHEPIRLLRRSRGVSKIGSASSTADDSQIEANRKISLYRRAHRWDPNLEDEYLDEVAAVQRKGSGSKFLNRMAENSPYPEVNSKPSVKINTAFSVVSTNIRQVRAAVRNYDEDLPIDTLRAWAIGMFLTTVGAGLNAVFSLRVPMRVFAIACHGGIKGLKI